MKQTQLLEIFFFVIGFIIGFHVYLIFNFSDKLLNNNALRIKNAKEKVYKELYEHELADFLFNEVKILCWVFTHPDNHKIKVPHVRQTWGRRCNKLLFMSVEDDPDQPDIIALPVENGREHLWNKTRLAMKYVYENHFNDADWFMRADDDNYIVIENLRHKLYQYHPQTSLYIGCRYAADSLPKGFMAGAGHIFSKRALEKFIKLEPDPTKCLQQDGEFDDAYVGQCLNKYAIFVDAHDDKNQKQIFPIRIEEHMEHKEPNLSLWYNQYLWNNVTQGGLECCSDTFIASHYILPWEMTLMEVLIYFIQPFGLQKNLTEELPRKLALEEIIKDSDTPSNFATLYREHERIHYIDDNEKH